MVLIRFSQSQPRENQLGMLSGRPEGKSRGNTISCTLGTGCGAACWHGAVVHSLILSPELSSQGGYLGGTKSWTALQLYQDDFLVGINEQVSGNRIRWPLPGTMRLLLGDWGCAWQGQTHQDHGQSANQQGGIYLNYMMANICRLEKRPWRKTETFTSGAHILVKTSSLFQSSFKLFDLTLYIHFGTSVFPPFCSGL